MLSVHLVFSQDLMPQVLASAGAYGETASGYSLSSTIGEQATETIAGDVSVLTQGFQQPQEVIIIIDNTKDLNIGASVQVFPNPTSDVLNIQVSNEIELTEYRLINRIGQVLQQEIVKALPQQLNISGFTEGLYLLELRAADGQVLTHQIYLSK